MRTAEIIEAHRQAGRPFTAAGVRSFVREEGSGPAVFCVHGMWGSSFLYRKVLHELAARGLRAIAVDMPGFGLAERPPAYDYSWSGLGRFCVAAVEALGLDRIHLIVHDIGGPVGFELATAGPERVLSLTILNTMIDVTAFKPPWSMEPFRHRGIGELWLAGMSKPLFRRLMKLQGIGDTAHVSNAELDTYLELMKGDDRGRAFLRIMRSTERTPEKQALYRRAVRDVPYPVQIVWAADDPALKLAEYGERARAAAGLDTVSTVRAKHFLQEDQAAAIADHVARLARSVAA
ncbi:MAG TPA: alpha/beta fold hydrolase [Ktedonobacterales bacterium]|nr:alpha/beta fold hydrolase [Ktedonobacterales bacterium]